MSSFSYEPSPAPGNPPLLEIAIEFRRHLELQGATALRGEELDSLAAHYSALIESVFEPDSDRDAPFASSAYPSHHLSFEILGIATTPNGNVILGVSLVDRVTRQKALWLANQEDPVLLAGEEAGALVLEIDNPVITAESIEVDAVRIGALMSTGTVHAQFERFLNGDLTSYFARQLTQLTQAPILPNSIRRVQLTGDGDQVLSFKCTDKDGRPIFASVGLVPNSRVWSFQKLVQLPAQGAVLANTRSNGDGEVLCGSLISFFDAGQFDQQICEGGCEVDDYIPAIKEGLMATLFSDWDESWSLEVSTVILPKKRLGSFVAAVRVVDDNLDSILPASNGAPLTDPMVTSVLVEIDDIESTDTTDSVSFRIKGFVLSEGFIRRDLARLCANPTTAFLGNFIYNGICGDLQSRGYFTEEERSDPPVVVKCCRVTELGRAAIDSGAGHFRQVWAVHLEHNHGEHVCVLFRNVPSGLVRLAAPTADVEGATHFDLGLVYFAPPLTS